MNEKKIAVIGVGGRTGTMFAFELSRIADVLGVGREINKKILVSRGRNNSSPLNCRIIKDSQWLPEDFLPDMIFLATRNPVGPVLKYYYQKCKERNVFPDLVLSQNGIQAGEEAINALKEILGSDFYKVRIVRISLFNPIDRQEKEQVVEVNYSLPIRLSFGIISGSQDSRDINSLFHQAGFQFKGFAKEGVKSMEASKLFFNLMGIASASRGLSVQKGFENKDSFREEVMVLKEYVRAIKAAGHSFINFPSYPVKTLSFLIEILPVKILLPFRKYFAKIIAKGREGKPKDLSEINYYNGVVVNLGEKTGISTSVNKKVVQRVLDNNK